MGERKRKREKPEPERDVSVDLGLGGIFKGLGDFLDLVTDMAEKGPAQTERTGEFRVRGLGDKARGVYGFSVRTGIGGIPQVQRFGNVRTTAEGPQVTDVREPLVDLFDEAEEVILVAELPGVADGEIQINVQGDVLALETTGERKYAKEVLLPGAVDAASLERQYRNGILELRLKKV